MSFIRNLKDILFSIKSSFNFPIEIENAYQKSSYPQSIFMMRLAFLLGASIHLSFFWLDQLMFPDEYVGVWMMRIFVLGLFFILFPISYRPFFAKIHQTVLFLLLLIITFGQFYALIITNSEEGSVLYYTGLLLVLGCTYSLSQLNLRNCIILSIIMLIGYIWIGVFKMEWTKEGWTSDKGLLLINNVFFLFSMSIVGIVIYITIQYFRRQGFLAQLAAEEERKKAALERLRIKISSDLHDDVGSILSGLSMQTEILQQNATIEDQKRLVRLGELSRSAMSRMRDAVWAMDARKDKWESLQDRMLEFAAETLGGKGIEYQIQFQDVNMKEQLPAEIRQNLYLIFKEAMTNVVKHSNATKVTAILKNDGSDFKMEIKDNGKLHQKEFSSAGLGLNNMKMRAQQIHAVLQFIRNDGFGILLQRDKI